MPRRSSNPRNRSRLPATVYVAGIRFAIKWGFEFEDEGDFGDSNHLDRLIRIGTKCVTAETKANTTFHELIHCALGVSGLSEVLGDKTEEAVVTCIENALFPHLDLLVAIRDGKAK